MMHQPRPEIGRRLLSRFCASLLSVSLLLGGCTTDGALRQRAETSLSGGNYEAGIREMQKSLSERPDSVELKAGLAQARAQASERLLSSAVLQRNEGKLSEATKTLERLLALEPGNDRAAALLLELETQGRQDAAVKSIEVAMAKIGPEAALRLTEQALKANDRHAGLIAMQRRLEVDRRQAQVLASQTLIAENRPISLDFRDAGLRTVLDVISRNSGINFVLDKDIKPDTRVTVFLRQAKFDDALDLVTSTNQLRRKVLDSKTIVIYPNTPEKQKEYEEQVVRVFYLSGSEAKGAAAFLKSMLKIREPFVEERTNMIAVRDSQETVQLAERLIALYDAGEPEVVLDVEVLEVSTSRLTELGVKLPSTFSLTPVAPNGAAGLTLGNVGKLTSNDVALGIEGAGVNLRREIGDVKTLANPKIRARNKEKASILIGDKIPVVTSTTGSSGFVSDTVTYLDVGLKLNVEPTVYADDEVAIKVALEVSSLGTAVKTASGTLAYQIGTRNATTVLRLRDGETQMLAGLISQDERKTGSRLPGIGDLPTVGRLFSDERDSNLKTELVLSITPRVLRNIRKPLAHESELWVGTEQDPKLRPVGGLRSVPSPAPAKQAASPAAAKAPKQAASQGEEPPSLQDTAAASRPTSAETAKGAPTASSPASAPAVESASAAANTASSESANDAAPVVPEGTPKDPESMEVPIELKLKGPKEVAVGDKLDVQVQLSSTLPLRGVPVQLSFDTSSLEFLDAIEGDYFSKDGQATSFTKSGKPRDGQLTVGVIRNRARGAQGDGLVATLRFKARSAGPAEVRVDSVLPLTLGAPPPETPTPQPLAIDIK